MTNFEKYKEDSMKIQKGFGVNKVTGKVTPCFKFPCEECIFRGTPSAICSNVCIRLMKNLY